MEKKPFYKKNFLSLIAIPVIFVIYFLQILDLKNYKNVEDVIVWDVIAYYEYLPAVFVHHDVTLKFLDDPNVKVPDKFWHMRTPDGGRYIKTSMGLSMMYSPFFFVAHAIAEPLGYEANGFTAPYVSALVFGCIIYVMIGLFFLRKVLLKYYKDGVVASTLLIICLATNLYYYATKEAAISHAYSFSLVCIFIFLVEKWYEKQSWVSTLFLGFIIGLISLIRPTNCLIGIIFPLYGICRWSDIKPRLQLFLKNYGKILGMVLVCLLVWLPQMLYWKKVTGQWFFYSYVSWDSVTVERFYFNDPYIWHVLFSFRKGWLIYTPVMVFAVIGMGLLWKINKKYFWPVLIFFVINLYIISSWWCWWYGGGFGMRPLIESYPLFAIPFAAFLTWMWKQKLKFRIPLLICVLALTFQSIYHSRQYFHGVFHWDSMTKAAYSGTFWRLHTPSNFDSLVRELDYDAAKAGDRNKTRPKE